MSQSDTDSKILNLTIFFLSKSFLLHGAEVYMFHVIAMSATMKCEKYIIVNIG